MLGKPHTLPCSIASASQACVCLVVAFFARCCVLQMIAPSRQIAFARVLVLSNKLGMRSRYLNTVSGPERMPSHHRPIGSLG